MFSHNGLRRSLLLRKAPTTRTASLEGLHHLRPPPQQPPASTSLHLTAWSTSTPYSQSQCLSDCHSPPLVNAAWRIGRPAMLGSTRPGGC
ncbi:hypothetical protein LINPERHAP1_LOCUS37863 [Linum perenne]